MSFGNEGDKAICKIPESESDRVCCPTHQIAKGTLLEPIGLVGATILLVRAPLHLSGTSIDQCGPSGIEAINHTP